MKSKILPYILFLCPIWVVGQSPVLSGTVTCADGSPLDGVVLILENPTTFQADTTMSSPNGYFEFSDLPGESDSSGPFVLQAFYGDTDPVGGLSTFDMVLMAQHLLYISRLQGYPLLAADYDGSGSISARDLVLMRKVILLILPDANVFAPRWRIWLNQIELPYTLDNLTMPLNLALTATKTGDVNISICK